MKRILFAFLLGMLTIICASAQELKVLEMWETLDVLSADKQRRDLNGNICAMLDVQLPIQGVIFQGNIIGDTPFVANGYQVFMTPGSKMVEVKCPGHYSTRILFADYGIESLSSKRIYRLKLQGTAAQEETGHLIFKVMPSNSQVSIDNVDYEPVNGVIDLNLKEGGHNYVVAAQGYKIQSNIFNITKGTDNKIVVELDRKQEGPTPSTNTNSINKQASVSNTAAPVSNSTSSAVDLTSGNYENGHEWVDLGLPSSLKWATCNVGANFPEEYGDHFAWSETKTKEEYNEDNSLVHGKKISWLRDGNYLDKSGNLTMPRDVAHQNWGGKWRMPTKADIEELIDNTTSKWTTIGGVNGRLFTSKKNGKSIFLPAAGVCAYSNHNGEGSVGFYMSSTPHKSDTREAISLHITDFKFDCESSHRSFGCSVRPVTK